MSRSTASRWFRLLTQELTQLAIAFIIIIAAFIALLYLAKFLWQVYQETPVGHQFLLDYATLSRSIQHVFSMHLATLSIYSTIAALQACLVIGGLSKLISLKRYLYDPQGFLFRGVLWGLPCTALTALGLLSSHNLNLNWQTAAVLGLPPTLAMLGPIFSFIERVVPELISVGHALFEVASKLVGSGKKP